MPPMKTMLVISSLLAMSFVVNAKEKEIVVKMFPTWASFERHVLWAYDFNMNGIVDPYEMAVARWLWFGERRPAKPGGNGTTKKEKVSPRMNSNRSLEHVELQGSKSLRHSHVQGGHLK